jgi:hypothetical protein
MKFLVFVAVVMASISLFASEPKTTLEAEARNQVRISRTDKSIELPASLVKKIKEDFLDYQKKLKVEVAEQNREHLNKLIRRYLSIEVEIWSESGLISRPILFEIPKGGGVIDFQSIIPAVPGKFNLKVKLKKNSEDISGSEAIKVYFVSNSHKRKIDKEEFGNGCDSYYVVTSYFKNQLSSGNSLFFTKEQRYLSFLAGTYVFTLVAQDEINIATVSFEDARFPNLQCRHL